MPHYNVTKRKQMDQHDIITLICITRKRCTRKLPHQISRPTNELYSNIFFLQALTKRLWLQRKCLVINQFKLICKSIPCHHTLASAILLEQYMQEFPRLIQVVNEAPRTGKENIHKHNITDNNYWSIFYVRLQTTKENHGTQNKINQKEIWAEKHAKSKAPYTNLPSSPGKQQHMAS